MKNKPHSLKLNVTKVGHNWKFKVEGDNFKAKARSTQI